MQLQFIWEEFDLVKFAVHSWTLFCKGTYANRGIHVQGWYCNLAQQCHFMYSPFRIYKLWQREREWVQVGISVESHWPFDVGQVIVLSDLGKLLKVVLPFSRAWEAWSSRRLFKEQIWMSASVPLSASTTLAQPPAATPRVLSKSK